MSRVLFRGRFWFSVIAGMGLAPTLACAQHVVGDIKIGQRVSALTAAGYSCQPSEDFPGLTRCERRKTSRGSSSAELSVVLHTSDGTALYVMKFETLPSLSESAASADIAEISRRNGGPTAVAWTDERGQAPAAVAAQWGAVRLEAIGREAEEALSAGKSAKQGVLIDLLGDLTRSAKEGEPVYRLIGGAGTVYTARISTGGAFRRLVAIDAEAVLTFKYTADVAGLLQRDQTLASDDFSLWPELAARLRRLALDTSHQRADAVLDTAARRYPSKLVSHLWSRIPGSVIEGLSAHEYRPGVDHYGSKTDYPAIRAELLAHVRSNPSDPFVEFAHYALGDPDAALNARPNSPVRDVLHYAIAHRVIRKLAKDIIALARSKSDAVPKGFPNSDRRIAFVNAHPELLGDTPIAQQLPTWTSEAARIRPHLKAVLESPKSSLADDAAYFLGVLDFHEGNNDSALKHFERAMSVGNGDYKRPAAMKQAIRILMTYPAEDHIARIEASPVLSAQVPLVYVAARSAYRQHQYKMVVDYLERALPRLKIAVDRFPSTTDQKVVESYLRRIVPKSAVEDDYDSSFELHLIESLYVLEASREMLRYLKSLDRLAAGDANDALLKGIRSIIVKYSLIIDSDEDPGKAADVRHRDLRQAIYLINAALEKLPAEERYGELREWLEFRKVRALVVFEPAGVAAAVADLRRTSPRSRFADDAMAEKVYVEGDVHGDIEAAERAFRDLLSAYPSGNAIDNAHSWMAIAYRCAGRIEDGRRIDQEIVRRFPLTRHAGYARKRLAKPEADEHGYRSGCGRGPQIDDWGEDSDDVENSPAR